MCLIHLQIHIRCETCANSPSEFQAPGTTFNILAGKNDQFFEVQRRYHSHVFILNFVHKFADYLNWLSLFLVFPGQTNHN